MTRVPQPELFLLLAASGCIQAPPDAQISPSQAALDANRAKWESYGIETYEYRFANGCECPAEVSGPIIISIVDGQVAAVRRPNDAAGLPPYTGVPTPTIPGLFDTVQSAIDDEPGAIGVVFDEEFGFPTLIYIDWDLGTADEETGYTAGDLVRQPRRAEFEANRAKWDAAGLDTYEYWFGNACSCPDIIVGPTVVTVEAGQVTA